MFSHIKYNMFFLSKIIYSLSQNTILMPERYEGYLFFFVCLKLTFRFLRYEIRSKQIINNWYINFHTKNYAK